MRTTLDIPQPLLMRAKIRAVESGTTLKALVVEALEKTLIPPVAPMPVGQDALFPQVRAEKSREKMRISPEMIDSLLAEQDLKAHAEAGRR